MANERLWGIPASTIWIAAGVIGISLFGAYSLYSSWYGVSTNTGAFLLKVGDALINGALVGIFFALVKAYFDLPKVYHEWQARRKAKRKAA